MARLGRGYPARRQGLSVALFVPSILAGSGNVSASFAATSSGVLTRVPASGALSATFAATGTGLVIVPVAGSLSASFAANGSVALALASSSVSATFGASATSLTVQVIASGTLSATFAATMTRRLDLAVFPPVSVVGESLRP